MKTNASKTEFIFKVNCSRGDSKGVMNKVKELNKKIEEFCKKKKNLALIRHSDVNQNWQKKILHLHETRILIFVTRFKKFLLRD